jgi:hypothetical protein
MIEITEKAYENFLKLDYEGQLVTTLLLLVEIIESNKVKKSYALDLSIKMCLHLDDRMCATAERLKPSEGT